MKTPEQALIDKAAAILADVCLRTENDLGCEEEYRALEDALANYSVALERAAEVINDSWADEADFRYDDRRDPA